MDSATLLTTCRRRAGMTQRELARRAQTSAAAVCLYERGDRVPRVDTLARLLAATGTTLELTSAPAATLDLAANGRDLEELLDLADELPATGGPTLEAPVFARLALR